MNISEPRLRSLLRQARKLTDTGKRSAAEQLYRQIIEEAPESVDAWLGLAAVGSDEAERVSAYEQVLDLSPGNQRALSGLARLRGETQSEAAESAADGESEGDLYDQSRQWLEQATAPASDPADLKEPTDQALERSIAATAPVSPGDGVDTRDDRLATDHEEAESHALVCYRHPNRDTSLRCYTCGRPICSECAVKTPVGYRCPNCIRESEGVFFNAKATDYPLAALVSFPISLLAGYLVLRFGGGFGFFFIFIMIFVGGAVGGLIGRITKRLVSGRRGRYLPHLVAANVVLGIALPVLALLALGARISLTGLLIPGIYLFTAASAAFYQMK